MRRAAILALVGLTASSLSAASLRDVESVHYHIHTDLDPGLTNDLAQRLDEMFEQYSARLADLKLHTNKKFEVYLFEQHQDYLAFTENKVPNSGGMFMPEREELAAYLEGQGRDYLRRTLQHEAFHQFASIAFKDRLPVWLNEGLAESFEEGIWTGKELLLGQVPPRRLRQLQANVENHRFVPFEQFMTIDHATWQHDMADLTTGQARYCQAWAMTHFLIFATEPNGKPAFRQRLIDMLDYIRNGRDGNEAWVKHFGNNYYGFQRRFEDYLTTLQPTPAAMYLEHQNVLADFMIEASHRGRLDSFDAFRQLIISHGARMRFVASGITWTSEEPETYFRDLVGHSFSAQQLYFGPRNDAPLPDLICTPLPAIKLETRFFNAAGKPDFETVVRSN